MRSGYREDVANRAQRRKRTDALRVDIWPPILRALDTEPTGLTAVRGASGLVHPLIAAGADEARKRLIVISNEPTARGAALAHADIQAASDDVRIIAARPVVVNLAEFADEVQDAFGTDTLGPEQFQTISSQGQKQTEAFLGPIVEPLVKQFAYGAAAVGIAPIFAQLIAQASQLKAISIDTKHPETGADQTEWTLDFSKLAQLEPEKEDLELGICPVPIYAFTEHELGIIGDDGSVEIVRQLLREHNVFQYFYPSPDQLALGIVDREPSKEINVIESVESAPTLGHPLGEMELVPQDTPVLEIIDALKERKLLVEGEITRELTPDGETTRATVKFTPQEGVVSKLVNRINVNIELSTKLLG
jgi:hypothetical protein